MFNNNAQSAHSQQQVLQGDTENVPNNPNNPSNNNPTNNLSKEIKDNNGIGENKNNSSSSSNNPNNSGSMGPPAAIPPASLARKPSMKGLAPLKRNGSADRRRDRNIPKLSLPGENRRENSAKKNGKKSSNRQNRDTKSAYGGGGIGGHGKGGKLSHSKSHQILPHGGRKAGRNGGKEGGGGSGASGAGRAEREREMLNDRVVRRERVARLIQRERGWSDRTGKEGGAGRTNRMTRTGY